MPDGLQLGAGRGRNGSSLSTKKTSKTLGCLLHVRNFAVQERHLQVLVHINHFRSQVDDLVGLAQSRLHLVGRLSLFDRLRLSLLLLGRRLLRRLLLTSLLLPALISTLLLISTTLLLVALLRVFTADREQLPDRILDLSRARRR